EADGLERGKDIFLERSTVLTAPTTASDWDADPNTGWQLVDTAMTTPVTGNAGEGPQIAELNQGDPNNTADDDGYVFLVDNYGAGGYRAFVTSGAEIAASERDHRLSQQDGWEPRTDGLPESPRHGSFVSASQQVLDAMHGWREVEAVGSQTALTASGRTVTAEVAADDDGEVAGEVTYSGDGWSETVALSDGEASAQVPASVQEVVARYEGYRDGLVEPSRSTALEIDSPATVDVDTATRCVAGQVVLAVTAGNADDETVTAAVSTPLGERTELTLRPGASRTATISRRRSESPAGEVTVDGDGAETTASYSSAPCGCGTPGGAGPVRPAPAGTGAFPGPSRSGHRDRAGVDPPPLPGPLRWRRGLDCIPSRR